MLIRSSAVAPSRPLCMGMVVLTWCFPFVDRLPSYSGAVDARRRVPRRQARVAASASVPAAAAATSAMAVVAAAAAVASEALQHNSDPVDVPTPNCSG